MLDEGSRVKLRPEATFLRRHPELRGAIGQVSTVINGSSWSALRATAAERERDRAMHVRFRDLGLIAFSVPATDLEPVDHLNPDRPL